MRLNTFSPPSHPSHADGIAFLQSHEFLKELCGLFQNIKEPDRNKNPLQKYNVDHTLSRDYFVLIGAMSKWRCGLKLLVCLLPSFIPPT